MACYLAASVYVACSLNHMGNAEKRVGNVAQLTKYLSNAFFPEMSLSRLPSRCSYLPALCTAPSILEMRDRRPLEYTIHLSGYSLLGAKTAGRARIVGCPKILPIMCFARNFDENIPSHNYLHSKYLGGLVWKPRSLLRLRLGHLLSNRGRLLLAEVLLPKVEPRDAIPSSMLLESSTVLS